MVKTIREFYGRPLDEPIRYDMLIIPNYRKNYANPPHEL